MVDLDGGYSNPRLRRSWDRLASKLDRLNAAETVRRTAAAPYRVRRPNEIRDAIVGLLAEREAPLSRRDIWSALGRVLEGPVSQSTVKHCLRINSAGPGAIFEKPCPGRYRLAKPLADEHC